MKISEMTMNDVEKRLGELDIEVRESQDVEFVKNAAVEKKELLERKKELEDLETRKRQVEDLNNGSEATVIERKSAKNEKFEVRDSKEYGKAFVKAIITGDDTEARALLTENVSGTIPVPTMLDNEIRNAWEESNLLSKVKQSAYPGNVKVGFEYSSTGAVVHVEGTEAPEEGELSLGTVELKAESIKKWITVSDEALEGTTIDTLSYIYKEIAQRIVEKAEEILIKKIIAAPKESTKTACGVPEIEINTLAEDSIIMALAELSGKAKNITLAMNRRTYAALKAICAKAKYNVDVFDGLGDKVEFTDALPPVSSAGAGETYIIAGDFGYGAQENKPNGNDMKIIVDEKSLAEKDLVKIVGKQYIAIEVVAPKAFVKIKKSS